MLEKKSTPADQSPEKKEDLYQKMADAYVKRRYRCCLGLPLLCGWKDDLCGEILDLDHPQREYEQALRKPRSH